MKQRVITALVGIPIVLAACFYTQPWFFGAIAMVAAVVGCLELGKLFEARPPLLGAMVVPAVLIFRDVPWALVLMALWVVGIGLVSRGGLAVHLASLWVGAPLGAMVLQHQLYANGIWEFKNWILITLVPLWIGDSSAIFAGKAFGKHLMAPTISPKKTWEGAIANVVGCLVGAIGVGYWIGFTVPLALGCGLISGTLGQVGDLFQSAVKRKVGAKDSGSILPGHGGILDRIDSLLFTAIPIYWILFYASK